MVKDSVGTFLTQILIFVIMLCSSVIIKRSIGVDGFGLMTKLVLIPQILWVFCTVGVDLMNVYYAGKQKENLTKLVSNSVWLAIGFGLFSIAIVSGGYVSLHGAFPQIDKLLGSVPPELYFLMLLTVPPFLIGHFLDSIIYGMDKILVSNLKKISTNLAYLIFILILVTDPDAVIPVINRPFSIGLNLELEGITYAHIMMMVFMGVSSLILITYFVKWKINSFDWKFFLDGLKNIGGYAFGATAATFLFFKVSIIVITYYIAYTGTVSDKDLGLYATATQLIEKVLFVPGAIAFALLPKVTSKSKEDIKDLTAKSARHTLMLIVVIMGVLSIFIRPLFITFFGADFGDACYPFWALTPGIVFYAVGRIFGTNLLGSGKVFYAFYFSIFTLILNLVLNILWVPKWGVTGSAAATSTAYIIHTILFFWALNRESKIPIKELLVFKKEDWEVYSRGFKGIFNKGSDQNGR